MTSPGMSRFALNQGRPRPPYTPRDFHCPHCGAGLQVKDEHSELIVCNYCGSHLDMTEDQAKVLGQGPAKKWSFPFELGDPFQYKGGKYEIIARMAFIEDGDYSELSRQYLLYNPRRGTYYLNEYKGEYSISRPTHVMPASDPFTRKRGDVIRTYDNSTWVTEGAGTYELMYVDGALPWIASIGDKITYAEFSEKNGSGRQFEAEAQGDEIEFGMGLALPLEMVIRATGKQTLMPPPAETMDAAQTRNWFIILILFSCAMTAINGFFWYVSDHRGSTVLEQTIGAEELSGEILTQPFKVSSAGNLIEVGIRADKLDNAWMTVDLAVVEGEEKVIHEFDGDMEYYHGYEGGESWSEGSSSSSTFIKIPKAGTYRLLVHAVSGTGDTESAESCANNMEITVRDGAYVSTYFMITAILCIIAAIVVGVAYKNWTDEDDD